MADQDREQRLNELRKREESQRVPAAVQELEITAEPQEGTEEQSKEVEQPENLSLDAGDVSAEAAVSPKPESSGAPGPLPQENQGNQGDQAAAGSSEV